MRKGVLAASGVLLAGGVLAAVFTAIQPPARPGVIGPAVVVGPAPRPIGPGAPLPTPRAGGHLVRSVPPSPAVQVTGGRGGPGSGRHDG